MNKRVPGSFPLAVADALRKIAAMFHAESMQGKDRQRAILAVAEHVMTLDLEDPRLNVLHDCRTACGRSSRSYDFEGGGTASRARLLSALGGPGVALPQPSALLDQLAAAATEDATAELRRAIAAASNQEAEQRRRADELQARIAQLNDYEATNAQHTTTIALLRDQLAESKRQTELFRALAGDGGDDDTPRRKAVEGHTGVYLTRSGKYEIGWTEPSVDGAKGKPGWQTIGDNLDDAITAREMKLAELESRKAAAA